MGERNLGRRYAGELRSRDRQEQKCAGVRCCSEENAGTSACWCIHQNPQGTKWRSLLSLSASRPPDGARALQHCHRGGPMRDMIAVTPVTPRHVWCDGAEARISWARHTSHTSHPIFIVRTKSSKPFSSDCHFGADAAPRRMGGAGRICHDWGDWGDAPSKSGRFRCHPSEGPSHHTCAVANETHRTGPRAHHHRGNFSRPVTCTSRALQTPRSREPQHHRGWQSGLRIRVNLA